MTKSLQEISKELEIDHSEAQRLYQWHRGRFRSSQTIKFLQEKGWIISHRNEIVLTMMGRMVLAKFMREVEDAKKERKNYRPRRNKRGKRGGGAGPSWLSTGSDS